MDKIISVSKIDSLGKIKLSGADLPEETKLYKLSFQHSRGHGISNGITKSFFNIAINNNTKLKLSECEPVDIDFSFCDIEGSPETKAIQVVYEVIIKGMNDEARRHYLETKKLSDTKENLLLEKRNRDLKHFADTTQYLHASLVALGHLDDLELAYKEDPDFFHNYLAKWEDLAAKDEYYYRLSKEIELFQALHYPKEERETTGFNWLPYFLGALLLNLLLLGYILSLRKSVSKLQAGLANEKIRSIDNLSRKEKEVYDLLIKGHSNKEIGLKLFIETNTVKSHTAKIYRKLNVNSRDELIKASK